MNGDYPELPGKPNVIMSILKHGRGSRREPEDTPVTRVWPDHADFKNRETEPGATEDRCPPEAGKGKEMDPL